MDSNKFPMAVKAAGEVENLLGVLGAQMPAELKAVHDRVAELIDAHTVRPAAEKDAIVAVSILMLAPPFIFDEQERFEKDYSPFVQMMIDEAFAAQPGTVPSSENAQGSLSVGIAMAEGTLRHLKSGAITGDNLEKLKTQIANRPKDQEAVMLQNLNAPALLAAFDKAFSDIENHLGLGIGAPPAPKKPNNPTGPR